MLYIVTTYRKIDAPALASVMLARSVSEIASRRAATTPEKAREAVLRSIHTDHLVDMPDLVDRVRGLPESRGTIGPLPDGTTVEVALVGRIEREQFALRAMLSPRATDEEWCAAYNNAELEDS
jgi:hypothetical protein